MKNCTENPKVHFRYTTVSQRKMLFKLVKEDGLTINTACVKCHIGESTYYYWQRRCKAEGDNALEHFKSTAPKHPGNKKPEILINQVLDLKKNNTKLGKVSIANLINKEHGWKKVISASTVGLILRKAGINQPVKKNA